MRARGWAKHGRPATRWIVLAVFAGVFLLVVATAAPERRAPRVGDRLGFAMGGAIGAERPSTAARELDAVSASGAGWVRLDVNWAVVQRSGPRRFDWSSTDRLIAGARRRGLRVLAGLIYTPQWARPAGTDPRYAPRPAALARFARRAAARYRHMGVHRWEIWNEPNLGSFYKPRPDPAGYARLLIAASRALHAADPSAFVITGGTSPAASNGIDIAPVEFLRAVYDAGAGGSFQAVGHHPYCFPAYPGAVADWSAWYQMYGTTPSLRSVMEDHGDGAKQIWATEYGAPTDGPVGDFVGEFVQSDMIARAQALWRTYPWAGPLFVFALRDLGTARTTRENFYGVLRHDFTVKPAYRAFQAAATAPG